MKRISFGWDKGILVFLVLTIIVGSFITPYFANASNMSFVIQDIGEFMLMALPVTFLIIAGEIDLSIGSTVCLSSCLIRSFIFVSFFTIFFTIFLFVYFVIGFAFVTIFTFIFLYAFFTL